MVRCVAVAGLVAWLGCANAATGEHDGPSTSTSIGDATSVGPTTLVSTSATDSSESNDSGIVFIPEPDGGSPYECDQLLQDCPRGSKCMPWANDGGSAWNATKCTPLAREPAALDEPCTVQESGVSGIDDCDIRSMCWQVDPETLMGTCVPFCSGTSGNLGCDRACDECRVTADGVLIVCLPWCEPLLQDCPVGTACHEHEGRFECLYDANSEPATFGSPCEYGNECAAGLTCANAEVVPGCTATIGCCVPFCSLAATDDCDVMLSGTACVEPLDDAPRGCIAQPVGVCVLP